MFKLFGMLENFFYISLGITFALILLLVYHFKQRLSTAEKKSDTMYEILTNVVQELNLIKSQTHHLYKLQHEAHSHIPVEAQAQAQPQIMIINEEIHPVDDGESVSESVSESDSESDGDSDYESECSDDGDEVDMMQLDDDVSVIKYELIEVSDPDASNANLEMDNGQEVILDTSIENENENVVSKTIPPIVGRLSSDVNVDIVDITAPETEAETTEKSVDIKRMNLTQLKSLAATKFPDLDVSKMKKAELIKILTE